MIRMSRIARFNLLVACISLVGCQAWSTPQWTADQAQSFELPPARMSADSVILEIAFVHVTPQANELGSRFWHDINETPLDWESHQRLERNGIRCGLVAGQIPDSLQQLIQADKNTLDVKGLNGNLDHDLSGRNQRIHSRAGRRGTIVLGKQVQPTMHLVIRDDDYASGETFHRAQCGLEIRTYPQGDGRVRIKLIPEIQYGELRSRYVGQDGSWLLNSNRETRSLDHLAMETLVVPGETVVLSSTPEIKGIGQHMFVEGKPGGDTQYLVLIRLVQTQFDDLFAPGKSEQPVTERWE